MRRDPAAGVCDRLRIGARRDRLAGGDPSRGRFELLAREDTRLDAVQLHRRQPVLVVGRRQVLDRAHPLDRIAKRRADVGAQVDAVHPPLPGLVERRLVVLAHDRAEALLAAEIVRAVHRARTVADGGSSVPGRPWARRGQTCSIPTATPFGTRARERCTRVRSTGCWRRRSEARSRGRRSRRTPATSSGCSSWRSRCPTRTRFTTRRSISSSRPTGS